MNDAAAAEKTPVPEPSREVAVPVLGHSVARLEDLSHRASTSMTHLVAVVESDPSLTLALFLTVNEHLTRVERRPAEMIQHAILVCGVAAFNERFTSLPRLEAIARDVDTRPLVQILAHGHHAARQARGLAQRVPGINSGEVMAAALFEQARGYLAALSAHPLSGFAPPGQDRLEASGPPLLQVDATESTARKCVAFGARVASAVSEHWNDAELMPLYEDIAGCLALEPAAVERTIKMTAVATARESRHFGCCPAAVHLLTAGLPRPPRTRAGPAAGRPSIRLALRDDEPLEQGDPLGRAVKSIAGAVARNCSSGELLGLALRSICRGTGYRLAVLLVRDKQSGDFVLRVNEGAALPEAYVNARLRARDNPLLEQLLRKQAAYELDAAANPRLAAGLDRELRRLIGSHKCMLYPVFAGGKAVGVVLACRPSASRPPDGRSFGRFKRICRETARSLEQLRRTGHAPKQD